MWWKKKKNIPPLVVCIQGSLQPHGLTDILLEEVVRLLKNYSIAVEIIDVRKRNAEYDKTIAETFDRAVGYLIAMPVYSAVISGAVKDLITDTSSSMRGKPVCLICAGKSDATYPASVDVVRLLSSCHVKVVKPIMRVHPESFRKDALFDEEITTVLKEILATLLKRIGVG